jgi:LPXTG-site transpeptidase (sortase) family protein
MLEKLQKNAKITLSILFIFIGIVLLSYNYLGSIKSNLFNEKNIELLSQQIELPEEVMNVEEEDEPDITTQVTPQTNYIGYLSVPDVNIKRGFTSLDSPDNKLSKNILLVKGSSMPDVKNGNLILAGHNGRSWYSFFNDLYKLKDGAHAYVTYNGRVYDYTLKNRYDVPKIGTITVQRNGDVNTLTLITCHRTDNHKQVVFIFELSNVTIA